MTKSVHGEGTEAAIAQRLERILAGRQPYPWAKTVAMSRGAMQRLLRGSFPDPVKLVPACRVENLSLSWFVGNIGQPYLVHAHATDDAAAHTMRTLLSDEPGWHIFVMRSTCGWMPILHRYCESETAEGVRYSYRAVEVIAGPAGEATAQVLVAPPSDVHYLEKSVGQQSIDLDAAGRTTYTNVPEDLYRQVAAGEIGTYAIFGTDAQPGGFAARANHALTAGYPDEWKQRFALVWPSVHETDAVSWLKPQQRELLAEYAKLNEQDRDTVLRMIRNLSHS